MTAPEESDTRSILDSLPDVILYALHVPYSLYLAARYRGMFLPAIANPGILTGGMAGESKTDLFALAGPYAREYFAPFITVRAGDSLETIRAALAKAGLSYPLVAKPDVGRNGRGVRIAQNDAELATHLARFPKDIRMVVQKYIEDDGEAGIFYVRKPSETRGRITSLTLKYFPAVVGDGISTVRELIKKQPRPKSVIELYMRRNARYLSRVLAPGERHPLTSVGNYVRGAIFADGASAITPELEDAFDRVAKDIRGFYYGRFDVRFSDLEELKHGRGFTLIEYNGASSEPTHVYAPHTPLAKIYRDMLHHWRLAYEVGAENRDRGVKQVSLWRIWKVVRDESKLIARYPDEE